MKKRTIIVGGVAGGASAAARLRRLDEEMEIIMFERGEYISFANCGLPYYIGGVITERNDLLVQTVEGMQERFNMDIRVLTEVIAIDPTKKEVLVRELPSGREYKESYDLLILSPGASPLRPPIPGIDQADTLFTLRSIPDTDKIKKHVETAKPQSAVVVGGGFIGLEMAENLHRRGIQVTIVEMLDQVMPPLDKELAAVVQHHLRRQGVKLILGDGVKSFKEKGRVVTLNSGREIETDMVVLSIGVRPENQLAKAAGLEVGPRGGIVVNEYLETSQPGIYAIGDAIQVTDYISGQPTQIPLAGPANKQGRIVADNIAGHRKKYRGTMGTAVAKIFDLTAALVGNNEKQLKQLGIDYEVVHVHPGSHAGYYPGGSTISMKLIFDRTGRILGAQAVGREGVEKRIDVIATAIAGGLGVRGLQELELSYAPPYSSAKDPVNMLGFAAGNILDGLVQTFQWWEVDNLVEEGALLLDVRDADERDYGFIPNSVNIPLAELREHLGELDRQKTIYVYCQVGIRGYLAARILSQAGFAAQNLDGGIYTYQMATRWDQGKQEAAATTDDRGVIRSDIRGDQSAENEL